MLTISCIYKYIFQYMIMIIIFQMMKKSYFPRISLKIVENHELIAC